MRQERHLGYEIKALSNLLRRKVLESAGSGEGDDFTEMQVKVLGFLAQNRDQEICQKDIEEAFYIRRSTASRLLKRLEAQGFIVRQSVGFIVRQSVERDARLKRVTTTPKADALCQQVMERIDHVETMLTKGLTQEEIDRFLATVEKLKRNLM